MQINLKKVSEICAIHINEECGGEKCSAMKVCWMFKEPPCNWDIAEMEEDIKQFNRGQNKKTYC